MIVRKADAHLGRLPKRWGFLEVSHPNVVTSALKPARDGSTILRVYEATGRATPEVKIKFHAKITSAHEANLIEDAGPKLQISNNTLETGLHPYEIKTFKFELQQTK